MKTKFYHVVYETTNVLNGMTYTGVHSTNRLEDGYLGSGRALKLAIRKHGRQNFTRRILASLPTADLAYLIERQMVDAEAVARADNYNLAIGGSRPPVGYGPMNSFYGRRHTLRARRLIGKASMARSKLYRRWAHR